MVRIRTLLILFIAVSGILATIAFVSYNQLQSAPPALPEEELEFWYQRGSRLAPPFSGGISVKCTSPVTLPRTFDMSGVKIYEGQEGITLHTYYFGTELNSGTKIIFSINATAPVDFQLVFANRTTDDIDAASMPRLARVGKLTIEAPHITSYRHELNVREKGIYIFVFDVAQPKPVATVTFKAEYGS